MGRPKRHILAAAEETVTPPGALLANQSLARVLKAEGNNQYCCELPNTKTVLVELAQRFRNTIWIKRGGYVLLERYPSVEIGRLEGEIINVVRDEKSWRKQPYWPAAFTKMPCAELDEYEDSLVGKLPPSGSDDEG